VEESRVSSDNIARDLIAGLGIKGDWEDLSPVLLAYVGDAVYDLILRTALTASGRRSPKEMHKLTTRYVSAAAQCKVYDALEEMVTEEEQDILRRGKNASPNHTARSASMAEYHKATGLEALSGYLFLTGKTDRAVALLRAGMEAAELKLPGAEK
jgi:ribonuclease-3 family protein